MSKPKSKTKSKTEQAVKAAATEEQRAELERLQREGRLVFLDA